MKSHIGHIFTKLELRDRAAAIVFAFDHGLVRAGVRGRRSDPGLTEDRPAGRCPPTGPVVRSDHGDDDLRDRRPVRARDILLGSGPRFARDAMGPMLAFYVGWRLVGLVAGIVAGHAGGGGRVASGSVSTTVRAHGPHRPRPWRCSRR